MDRTRGFGRGALLGLALLLAPAALGSEDKLAFLEVGAQTYTNVTVTSKTPRYIMIAHAQGLTSVKLKDLSDEVLKQLGYHVEPPPPPKPKTLLPASIAADPRVQEIQTRAVQEVQEQIHKLNPNILIGIAAGCLLIYLSFCYCNMLICKKVGQEPGVLVWLPILQAFPMLRAAGMSAWWFVLFLLPVLSAVATIVWCVKICQARGKSGWLAVPLLLPVTGLFTFLYLAFADGGGEKDSAPARITFN